MVSVLKMELAHLILVHSIHSVQLGLSELDIYNASKAATDPFIPTL